jgi:hypothetical protein
MQADWQEERKNTLSLYLTYVLYLFHNSHIFFPKVCDQKLGAV